MAQQGGFAASAHPQNGDDFPAWNGEVDAFQYLPFAIREVEIADLDQVFRGLRQSFRLLADLGRCLNDIIRYLIACC
jgi:hypothetical protein